jgi:hypothetical protein
MAGSLCAFIIERSDPVYTIKEAFPVEDGALHGPNGRYFLPVVTTGEGKKLTVTGAVVLAVSVAIVLVIAFLGSDWLSKDYADALTYYEKLIGSSRETVFEALDVDQEDITEVSACVYVVADEIELYNMDFDLVLYLDENTQLLRGYGYRRSYHTSPETSAKHVSDFVNKLGYKKPDGELLILEEAELLKGFTNKEEFHLNQSWNLTPGANVGGAVSQYLQELENSEDWPGRVAGLLAIPAAFYRDLDISYDPHDQILSIQLRYSAEARRTGFVADIKQ